MRKRGRLLARLRVPEARQGERLLEVGVAGARGLGAPSGRRGAEPGRRGRLCCRWGEGTAMEGRRRRAQVLCPWQPRYPPGGGPGLSRQELGAPGTETRRGEVLRGEGDAGAE